MPFACGLFVFVQDDYPNVRQVQVKRVFVMFERSPN